VAALRLADAIREDAKEALELALRFYEQTLEDHDAPINTSAGHGNFWLERNRTGPGCNGLGLFVLFKKCGPASARRCNRRESHFSEVAGPLLAL
jgi:hypothetical protein